jgi:hypothetical protein
MFRDNLWNLMLDADLNARYWSELLKRYYSYDKRYKIFLALMSAGSVASLGIWSHIQWVWTTLYSLSTILAIVLPFLNWPKKIEMMASLTKKWITIKNDYENLWSSLESGRNIRKIETEYNRIRQEELEASKILTKIPSDDKLLWKCRNDVLKSRGLKQRQT